MKITNMSRWTLTMLFIIVTMSTVTNSAYPADKQTPETTDPCTTCISASGAEECIPNMVQNVYNILPPKPHTDYFNWGFEQRTRQEYVKNAFTLSKDEDNRNYFRFRQRLWFELTPAEWLVFYVRFANEFRAWMTPNVNSDLDEVIFDNIYVHIKRPANLPVSFKLGRQDLKYGSGFTFIDGTPLDGTRSFYSDVLKGTLHLDAIKTDIDALVIDNNRMDRKFFKFNPSDNRLVEQEIQAYGYYLTSKYFGEPLQIEQYYIYKDGHGQPIPGTLTSDNEKLNTFGGRLSGTVCENIKYESELTYQFGKQGTVDREAWGTYALGTYNFPVKFDPYISLGYYYLSGDDPNTSKREDWDPLFGRCTTHGDLLLFTYIREGGLANWANMHKLRVGAGISPLSWWDLTLTYDHLWADENTYLGTPGFSSGKDRGDLIIAFSKFKFTDNVSAFAQVEYFHPGGYYVSEAEPALFFRWEFKVSY